VSSECWVHFQGARYSLPPAYVGQTVLVELHSAQQRVVIRAEQVIVADHPQATTRGATVSDPAHLAALWQLTLAQSASSPVVLAVWLIRLPQLLAPRCCASPAAPGEQENSRPDEPSGQHSSLTVDLRVQREVVDADG
jgi:hypothetical protein